jgi:hypothetical protein
LLSQAVAILQDLVHYVQLDLGFRGKVRGVEPEMEDIAGEKVDGLITRPEPCTDWQQHLWDVLLFQGWADSPTKNC